MFVLTEYQLVDLFSEFLWIKVKADRTAYDGQFIFPIFPLNKTNPHEGLKRLSKLFIISNLKFSPVSVRRMLILDAFLAVSNRLNIIFQLTLSLGTWACMHIRLLYDSPTSYC